MTFYYHFYRDEGNFAGFLFTDDRALVSSAEDIASELNRIHSSFFPYHVGGRGYMKGDQAEKAAIQNMLFFKEDTGAPLLSPFRVGVGRICAKASSYGGDTSLIKKAVRQYCSHMGIQMREIVFDPVKGIWKEEETDHGND